MGKIKKVLKQFESELAILKRLRHRHIIEFIGSYTDSKFVGLVMSPVADCNLKEFLGSSSFSQGAHSILWTYFGCLSAGICYLHDNSVRHKDIKPENILVKASYVLLAEDFGQSLDWSESQHSTTSGFTLKTPKYCAPEVANYRPRNSSSDMWSLGCAFFEIWTVLTGASLQSLEAYFNTHGSQSLCYYLNVASYKSWTTSYLHDTPGCQGKDKSILLRWVSQLVHETPEARWTARMLLDDIKSIHEDPENTVPYLGSCCIADGESAGSIASTEASLLATSTTSGPSAWLTYANGTSARVSTDLTQQLSILPTGFGPESSAFVDGINEHDPPGLPHSMLIAIKNRFLKEQIPAVQKIRAKTKAELKRLPFFMKEECVYPAVVYAILKAAAERSTSKSPRTKQSKAPTLKDIALKMSPAILRGFARHTVQGDTQSKETMIPAEPSSEVHGMIVFGLSNHRLQALHDYQGDDEILVSSVVEITLSDDGKMLMEVGCYVWCDDLRCLVRCDKEPSLNKIQERYWYREWMSEHIAEEERALAISNTNQRL